MDNISFASTTLLSITLIFMFYLYLRKKWMLEKVTFGLLRKIRKKNLSKVFFIDLEVYQERVQKSRAAKNNFFFHNR